MLRSKLRGMRVAALAAAIAMAQGARAQAPVGPQFKVNNAGSGLRPQVDSDASGNFVAVWDSVGTGTDSDQSIQARRYDNAGVPLGSQFQVNAYTTGAQVRPGVAVDAAGGFVVVWLSYGGPGSDTDQSSIQAQRFDGSGAPQGAQFQVNTYTTNSQLNASIAGDSAGNFVVVWSSVGGSGTDTDATSVQGRRYDSAGVPQGGEFQVNTYTTSTQTRPAVAANDVGSFLVAWESDGSSGSDVSQQSIQAQRYDASGALVGGEFQVNTFTTSFQGYAAVDVDGSGNFVVVWAGLPDAGLIGSGIGGQRYDASGMPAGAEFLVNTYQTSAQSEPSVAYDGTGAFIVAWSSFGSAGSDQDNFSIDAQRFDGSGLPDGGEIQVNTFTTAAQNAPSVAADATGDFVVVWDQSVSYVGSVQGQRFTVGTTSSSTSSTVVTTTTSTSSTSSTVPLLILGKKIQVKAPTGVEDNRKILVLGKETSTDIGAAIVGDPRVNSATLTVITNGTTDSAQTYVLDASGWSAAGSVGYKYTGPTTGDPVKKILLKRTPGGTAFLKALIKGNTGTQPLDVVPPNPGDDGGVILTINGGRTYCVAFGGAAGGSETADDAQTWQVKNPTSQPGCPVSATTSTTIPSCTTPFSACGSCGTGLCVEHCDSDPPGLVCIASSVPGGCTDDAQCSPGQVCNGVPSQCGSPTSSGCGVPCP